MRAFREKEGQMGGLTSKKKQEPALLSLVEEKWIEQAFANYFSRGKEILYFCTNSNIKATGELNIRHVYFKLKGKTHISLKAKLVGFSESNPAEFRLPGCETEKAKYYYGFSNLTWVDNIIDLPDLEYYKTGKNLRTDLPGACIIVDPNVD